MTRKKKLIEIFLFALGYRKQIEVPQDDLPFVFEIENKCKEFLNK